MGNKKIGLPTDNPKNHSVKFKADEGTIRSYRAGRRLIPFDIIFSEDDEGVHALRAHAAVLFRGTSFRRDWLFLKRV